MSLASSIEKKIRKKVVGEVEDLVEDRIDSLIKEFGNLSDGATEAFNQAKRAHNRLNWYANGGIITKIVEQGDEYIMEQFRDKITDLLIENMAEVLEEAADTIELVAPARRTFNFGIELALVIQVKLMFGFTIVNPVSKLTEIRHWAEHPPKGLAQIMDCVRDFGPPGAYAGFEICGNGYTDEWDGEQFYDKLETLLESHGVK